MWCLRPFVDFEDDLVATELEFFSDASLNEHFRIGARFRDEWFFAQWPVGFIKSCKPSIQYVELLGLTMAVFTWIKYLAHRRVIIFCDNLAGGSNGITEFHWGKERYDLDQEACAKVP